MELIVISESKLKIMLSGEDMVKYELEEERVEGCDAHTRRVFRRIFEDARAAVGFETLGERLLVQYYATGDGGGCEIFVTKLGTEDFFRAEEGEEELLRQIYACEEETGALRRCFSFRRPEELLAVCRRLRAVGYEGASRVYIAEGTREVWYLFLEIPWAIGSRLPKRLAFLREYGEAVDEEWGAVYLAEHGRLICGERAVEVLGGM
jgi:negative regulator of genetic competence, sporulation and motility